MDSIYYEISITIFVLLLTLIIIIIISRSSKSDEFEETNKIKIENKVCKNMERNDKIPRRIIQTYFSRDVFERMYEASLTFKNLNPDFDYIFYDDEEIKKFLQTNYKKEVLEAFDLLIPGAFKADLFRLAELYINGGYYADIFMVNIESLTCLENYDIDCIITRDINENFIYNAFLACKPKNNFIKHLLDKTVENVLKKNIGNGPLDVTGPEFIGKIFKKYVNVSEIKLGIFTHNKENFLILEHEKNGFVNINNISLIKRKYNDYLKDTKNYVHYSDLYKNNEIFKNVLKENWTESAKDIIYKNGYIKCWLKTKDGNWKYNEMEFPDIFRNIRIENIDGNLTICPDKQEEEYIMKSLFPKYNEETKNIKIESCYMLSVDIDKYNKIRNETLNILNNYKLPKINIFYGYSNDNYEKSLFNYCLTQQAPRKELTLGMLEIFYIFLKKYPDGEHWMFYFEDDVRPENIEYETDLTNLYNVPKDAEMIRLFTGKKEKYIPKYSEYKYSWGGGLNHAFIISNKACKKIINYAEKYKWKHACDIDIYKIARGCTNFPTGYDAWSLSSVGGVNNISNSLLEEEKINLYDIDIFLFNQTSNPV